MSGHRGEKMASSLQRAVQQVLTRGLQDPRTEGSLITVTRVQLTPDGREAEVWVSVLPDAHEARVLAALRHAGPFIRREAGELVAARALPAFRFEIDHSLKRQAGVLGALGNVAREREQSSPAQNIQGNESPDSSGPDTGAEHS